MMTTTRRQFVKAAAVLGSGLTLCGAAPSPKRLLILGGTGFIGPNMVRYAVARGHQVTIFTRGRTKSDIPGVEHLIGDRNDDHSALEGRTWDVVLDNNSRDYRWVRTSTELLKSAARHYILISSISVYDNEMLGYDDKDTVLASPVIGESFRRVGPPADWVEGDEAPYGFTKALAEDAVHQVFAGRSTIVRPGLIVGPGDPTDRFTYWPVRLDEGGEVLAPGNPNHSNQIIDQRDLTEWIVRLAEEETRGDFNATGPADRLSMGSMLEQIGGAIETPHSLTWVSEDFLQKQDVAPWTDLPTWIPGDPLSYVNVSKATAAGLSHRSIATIARDTLEWDKTRPAEERQNRQFGMSRARESELLAAWHENE